MNSEISKRRRLRTTDGGHPTVESEGLAMKFKSSILVATLVLGIAQSLTASESDREANQFAEQIKPMLTKHCRGCHSGEKPKGDFAIDGLSQDFDDKENRKRWLAVLEQITAGTMPPKEKPRPPAEDIKVAAAWISKRAAAAQAGQGRVVLRRLNRNEYQNTVRDLLSVEVDLQDVLPIDEVTNGFDNSADALHVSAYLMENYLEAAERVLDAAIASGPRPPTNKKRYDIKDERSVKPKGSVYRHVDDGVAVFSSWVSANIQVTLWNFQTRGRGRYRFRISGYGFQTEKPVSFHVMAGPMNAAAQQYLIDYFDVPADKPTVVEFTEPMESAQTIRIIVDRLGAIPPDVEKVGAEKYKGPGLVVQWVEIEGPLLDSWPPPSHRQIFGDLQQVPAPDADNPNRREVASEQPLVDAERILRDFTRRAFRRAVTDDDIKPFLARVRTKLDQGASFEQAMRVGLRGVLVSPHFLFLREKAGTENRTLDDFALASRLSYFLWSSMPDEELFKLAEQGAFTGRNRGEPAGVSPRTNPTDRNSDDNAVRG